MVAARWRPLYGPKNACLRREARPVFNAGRFMGWQAPVGRQALPALAACDQVAHAAKLCIVNDAIVEKLFEALQLVNGIVVIRLDD